MAIRLGVGSHLASGAVVDDTGSSGTRDQSGTGVAGIVREIECGVMGGHRLVMIARKSLRLLNFAMINSNAGRFSGRACRFKLRSHVHI